VSGFSLFEQNSSLSLRPRKDPQGFEHDSRKVYFPYFELIFLILASEHLKQKKTIGVSN